MTTTTVRIAECTTTSTYTTRQDIGGTVVLLDTTGAIVHRYANQQAAERGANLHAHPDACHTCLHGCDCRVDIPSHGCGHYGCWGPSAAETCAFAAVVRSA